jgi:S1-C subfamily serine protease
VVALGRESVQVGAAVSPPAGDPAPPPAGRRPRRWVLVGAVLAVLVTTAGALAWRASNSGPPPLTRSDVDKAVAGGLARAQAQQRAAPPDGAVAYRQILPSLVTVIDTPGGGAVAATPSPAPSAAASPPPAGAESDLGAGVVIDAKGEILTAWHVVQRGGAIQVRFTDGTVSAARVVQSQPASDIAVLAADHLPSVVVPAVMGGGAQVGDAVFPVGNPLGLIGSLSAGVVSALGRTVHVDGGPTLSGLIQFDAAVNPGNSGGPLLDRDGRVVGIVTSLANPSHQPYFVGIGFAVPIATAGGAAGAPPK